MTRPALLAGASPRRARLHGLSTVLIVIGTLLLCDAAATMLWQEPVTALWARLRQDRLASDLRALQRAAPSDLEMRALRAIPAGRRRFAFLAAALRAARREGAAVGRIRIRSIGVDFVVVKGTAAAALESGPGIYPWAAFPGAPGTVAIAGHRTTYLAPFRHLDALRRGATIELDMPYGRFDYAIEGSRIVRPTDVGVLAAVGYDRLVLTACHPLYSVAQRIVVFARLRSSTPRGAASAT